MANLLIGDIHGCYTTFMKLLEKVQFSSSDTLWLSGDLVARGKDSLAVLRFVYQHRDQIKLVLGNHEFHLLSLYTQIVQKSSSQSHLQAVLEAPDCDQLVNWLRHQPLLQIDTDLKIILTHAGFYPKWNLEKLQSCAQEVNQVLASDAYPFLIDKMYGDYPDLWRDDLFGFDRLRFIINALTRMRFCDSDGRLDLKKKGKPNSKMDLYMKAWFEFPRAVPEDYQLFFGHWGALEGKFTPDSVFALDTGCCWDGKLSCYHFEEQRYYRKKNKEPK